MQKIIPISLCILNIILVFINNKRVEKRIQGVIKDEEERKE